MGLLGRVLPQVKVVPSGCWEWQGKRNAQGYGQLYIPERRRCIGAHRASFELYYGPFDQKLFVCHHCDNPCCVNPDHLFLGTHADNMADAARKERMSSRLKARHVILIADRYAAGHDHRDIAREFGVTAATVQDILLKRSRRHVCRRSIQPRADLHGSQNASGERQRILSTQHDP